MSNPNIEERRSFTRITFDGSCSITQGSREWPVKLIDISLKGILVDKPDNWDADCSSLMDIHVHVGEDITITMSARWCRTEDDRMGFECDHIDLDSIAHLRRLVELNVGNPILLERELAFLGA